MSMSKLNIEESKMAPTSDPHPIFDNDLLLDRILDFAIHDKGQVDISAVQRLRRVNRKWIRSVSTALWTAEHPLYVFYPMEDKNKGKAAAVRKEKKLVQFMKQIRENNRLIQRIPPFAIKISDSGAQKNSSRILFDCLTNFGHGLVELDLRLAEIHPLFPLNNKFDFPKLHTFNVELRRKFPFGGKFMVDTKDKINFIQSVFAGSRQLKTFTINNVRFSMVVPDNFGDLIFPPSLCNLDLKFPLKDSHLQALANSSLPKLQTLRFSVDELVDKHDIINCFLKKVCKNLEILCIAYQSCVNQVGVLNTFQFNCMENLQSLTIFNAYPAFKLDTDFPSLQKFVPKLSNLTLSCQSKFMLQKWTEHCLPTVTTLKVSRVFENDEADERIYNSCSVNIDLDTMEAVQKAFPSVKDLTISVVSSTEALGFVMREMKGLRSLNICLENTNVKVLEKSDSWDAAFTGISQSVLEALREYPSLLGSEEELLQTGNGVSLRDMTELETLGLESEKENNSVAITDMSFHYAFLKMPKLSKLIFKGAFVTTKELAGMWEAGRDEGRSIETAFYEDVEDESGTDWEGQNYLGPD